MNVTTVAGTRPEIIKLAPLISLLDREYACSDFVFTGQHYSTNMKNIFFKDLDIREPDYDLSVKSSDYAKLTNAVYSIFKKTEPDYVLVYGDTNSTLAGAIAARMMRSKLIHLEAGLRSFDLSMPEERNRIIVDRLSDFYFAPTELSKSFLMEEGHPEENIYVTGNLVVDACNKYLPKALDKKTFEKPFLLATLHRQENVDNPTTLGKFAKEMSEVDEKIIFPAHPRTTKRMSEFRIEMPENVKVLEPMGYFDFLNVLSKCDLILTDAGGVQEEAITLKKPCITMRNNTERQETVELGANVLYRINSGSSLGPLIREMKSRSGEISKIKNPYGENVAMKMLDAINYLVEDSD